MGVVRKSFDKDNIDLSTYLKTVRQLSSKQAKQIIKMRKLVGSGQQPGVGMQPSGFQQPGMQPPGM